VSAALAIATAVTVIATTLAAALLVALALSATTAVIATVVTASIVAGTTLGAGFAVGSSNRAPVRAGLVRATAIVAPLVAVAEVRITPASIKALPASGAIAVATRLAIAAAGPFAALGRNAATTAVLLLAATTARTLGTLGRLGLAGGSGQAGGFLEEVLGQRLGFQLHAGELFDVAQVRLFVGSDKARRHAVSPGARGAADAVDVLLRHVTSMPRAAMSVAIKMRISPFRKACSAAVR